MGLYVRKAFKLGPLRLNMSKRGVGVSIGMRGARVGITSAGREYLHAGREGIYYRRTIGEHARTAGRHAAHGGHPMVLLAGLVVFALYGVEMLKVATGLVVASVLWGMVCPHCRRRK